ncbi:MAG: hypothetical protein ACK4F7_04490 [Inhella sp.]
MHKTRRISQRLRRLLAALTSDQRASLQGLDVQPSDFGAWLDAGGDRRQGPRTDRQRR